jgi:thioredoxin 1
MEKINSTTFEKLTKSETLTLVKFGASWCSSCKILDPILDKVSDNYPNINSVEIDVESEGELAKNNGVRGVPTVIIFKDGNVLERIVGLQPIQSYNNKIESFLN